MQKDRSVMQGLIGSASGAFFAIQTINQVNGGDIVRVIFNPHSFQLRLS